MRESSPRGWHRWRVAAVTSAPAIDRMSRRGGLPVAGPAAAPHPDVTAPDGIRHELVARVRQQIADGTYDTEEKWALAEEALLRRVEGRR